MDINVNMNMQENIDKPIYFMASSTDAAAWSRVESFFINNNFQPPSAQKGDGYFGLRLPGKHSSPVARHIIKHSDLPLLIQPELPCDEEAWLRDFPELHLLLVHGRPEQAILHGMENGMAPEVALDKWLKAVQRHLQLNRQYPGRVSVIDAEAAAQRPEILTATLESRIHWSLEMPSVGRLPDEEDNTSHENPVLLLAACMVLQSEAVQDVLNEVVASSINESELDLPLSIDYSRMQEQLQQGSAQDLTQVQDELDDSKEEKELLLLQLHQAQEELEKQHIEKERLSAEVSNLSSQLTQPRPSNVSESEITDLKQALSDEKEENELLLLQLHQVQEELERYYHKLQKAEKRIDMIHQSTSWRITAPLRSIMLALRGKKASSHVSNRKVYS